MAKKLSINLNGKYQRIKTINDNYIQNEIYFTEDLTPEILSKIPLVMPNLTSYKLLEDRLVLKTPIVSGDSVYEHSNITSSTRIDVINKYLKTINKFSELPIFLQINLMRLENFYLAKGELIHRGVLIVEDCKFDYPFTNKHLLRAISFFVLKIIHGDPALINFENYFKNLDDEEKNISDIIDDIKNIYIRDLFKEKKFTSKVIKTKPKLELKNLNPTFVFSIILFLFFLVGSVFLIVKATNNNISELPIVKIEEKKENTSYILIDRSFSSKENSLITYKEWNLYEDGKLIKTETGDIFVLLPLEDKKYRVTLKVKDSNGTWSNEINKYYQLEDEKSIDQLNNFNISGAKFNNKVFREGSISIDMNKSNKNFYINEKYLSKKVNLSFYLKATEDKNLNVSVSAYPEINEKGKTSSNINLRKDEWQKITLNIESAKINKIRVKIEYDGGNVFLDELSLSSSNE